MFIRNISDFENRYFYICDKKESENLLNNGFSLLGIEEGKYYYFRTEKLNKYIEKNGVIG